jgi:hypothetical protein
MGGSGAAGPGSIVFVAAVCVSKQHKSEAHDRNPDCIIVETADYSTNKHVHVTKLNRIGEQTKTCSCIIL